ncbi:phosphofurin acidic cluster sorting protein 2-like isoform X1 [Gigantopelta aegis]|uniref:phosphofurin acidic cluster sorting protein 2-like isoform X1 n=1 Tax=Gigantopelta aegis TaxID=1735272 RepID=UPI001B88D662|nr:phosphofurin acidic cluster sorting protein 2-like isoform X1 [Gigantopelta aegis]
MADKVSRTSTLSGAKPVPMKLFASWEIEKTSPNCVPRLCTLTLTRLVVQKPLENDLTSITVAVKMQSSKRILRSNEILVPPNGLVDTELELSFSLQYPHFIKRDGNRLQVMLQRRKKYKNRTILGFKTLAIGQVNMSHVLQRSVDKNLNLFSDLKEHTNLVAHVTVLSLSSQPVDHEDNGNRKPGSSDIDRSPDVDIESDEEDIHDYNDQDYSSNDEMSDSEPMMLDDDGHTRPRKTSRGKVRPVTSRQRNIKQKFIALLKKFKVSEDVLDSEADHDLIDPDAAPADIDDLFDELDDLSDSGPELDTLSVMSTPKPRLRPFFTVSRSSNSQDFEPPRSQEPLKLSDDSSPNLTPPTCNLTPPTCNMTNVAKRTDVDINVEKDVDLSDSQTPSESSPKLKSDLLRPKSRRFMRERSTSYREKKTKKEHKSVIRRSSYGRADNAPRKALLDQLSNVLGNGDDRLPDNVFLVNTAEWQGQVLVQKLQDKQWKIICTCSDADVKASISFFVNKIQKFCNSNPQSPCIKVGVAGGDCYINSVLRPYVEQFSAKSPDWQNFIRFLVIPFGTSCIGKCLAAMDSTYASLFSDSLWKDTFDKTDPSKPSLDSQEIVNRLSKYLTGASNVYMFPIAEVMVMCKGKCADEESSQKFIPFLSEVKIGTQELTNTSVEFDEGAASPPSQALSSSPPTSTIILKPGDAQTPPSSPNISALSPSTSQPSGIAAGVTGEFLDLQVDYWIGSSKSEGLDKASKKDSNKCSLKTAFRSIHVCRLSHNHECILPTFTMSVVVREKKQKIMRIGKKTKELESKSQIIDGISRLICTSKSQNVALNVVIDGVEWKAVRFFQLSSQWQTHIKSLPVATFGFFEPVL